MRKPAVVVGAAVSAVLAGGIMVATSAGAETTPELPGAPSIAVPDVPDLPSRPASTGAPAVPGHPAGDDDRDEPTAGPAPARPGGPAAAKPGASAGTKPARPADDDPAPGTRPPHTATAEPDPRPSAHRDVAASQAMSADLDGDVQRQARDLVNRERRRAGCDDVTVDRRLIVAADGHAADMARRGYFAHADPDGDRAGERVRDAGYSWSRFGENIARGQNSVYEVVDDWMNSPEHRANILDCRLHQVGLGLAFSADRTPYWVQNFATPE